jgi:hypothetical protein
MKNPPKYLTHKELSNLNDARLNNVRKSIIRKRACIWNMYACDCCGMINSVWESEEYSKKDTPLKKYLELIYMVINGRKK